MIVFNSVKHNKQKIWNSHAEMCGIQSSCMMALEPRIMFDGALGMTATEVTDVVDAPDHNPDNMDSDQAEIDFRDLAKDYTPPLVETCREIIFIDSAVKDYEQLIQGVSTEARVVTLVPTADGISQITQELARHTGLEAVHIVSHGGPAGLQFGSGSLSLDNIDEMGGELQTWQNALGNDADILIYGCDVGAGIEGQIFVQKLSELTGADVAASNDTTGHNSLGGDWNLEEQVGYIETSVALDDVLQESWQGTLDTAELVSVDSTENLADGSTSDMPASSSDGRYVVFQSNATNLVAGDTNACSDIFLHDRHTDQTTRISVDSIGTQADSDSYSPSISSDGRYVVFESGATNLVAGDTNAVNDIFVHDTQTDATIRVSVDSIEMQANAGSNTASISNDGRFIAFISAATNLVPDDSNGLNDAFIHDQHTGETDFASTILDGGITASGAVIGGGNERYLLLTTSVSLVGDDTNGLSDAYLIDRNDAPILNTSGNPALNPINENPAANPGTSSFDFYSSFGKTDIFDPDYKDEKMGIAVTGADNTNGTWQYSLDVGASWNNFGAVSNTSAILLKGPVDLESWVSNSTDLNAGDLLINSYDVGGVTLTSTLVNGLNMTGAYNLYNAINAISGSTDVIAAIDTLYSGSAATGGVAGVISFDINGVNVSVTINAIDTNFEVAQKVADKIMTIEDQTGVGAWVGNGNNGGVADSVVMESHGGNTFEITNLTEGPALSGLSQGTYSLDANHNGGRIFLIPTSGGYTVSTSAGDDSILSLIGLAGGENYTGIALDIADNGTISVNSTDNFIRFVPNADFYGSANFTFRAWDQSDGLTNGATGVDVSVNGGSTAYSTAFETASIAVNPVNDPPVVAAGGLLNYTENDPASVIDPGIVVSDIDSSTIASAQITISANYAEGEDVLGFTDTGAITGSWDSATATLTLTGTDTVANYQIALRSVTYENTDDSPSTAARTISFSVNDGDIGSSVATSTINVTETNDAPVLSFITVIDNTGTTDSDDTTDTGDTTTYSPFQDIFSTDTPSFDDTFFAAWEDLIPVATETTTKSATTEAPAEQSAETTESTPTGEAAETGEESRVEGEEEIAQEETEAEEEEEGEEKEEEITEEEQPPEAVAVEQGKADVEAKADASKADNGKKGLSEQLAREKAVSEVKRAEILEIFSEVFDLLQCN